MEIRDDVLTVLKPHGGQEEIDAVAEVIRSGWWGKGPKVDEFEKAFAEMVGAKYAIAVDSATSGLDLVLKGLDMTLDQGMRLEADLNFILQSTSDRVEGIGSFLERRGPPQFRGQ